MKFLDLNKKIQIREEIITSAELIEAATATNSYIKSLVSAFNELGFDIFYSLGQRNISGFVGEIFKHILAAKHEGFVANPHPDGRPDILSVDTKEIQDYYENCFITVNERSVPIKDLFTPFKYGGLEVKCSIGSSGKPQNTRYIQDHGHTFDLYEPRVGYLNGITWWAHHSSSSNLLGLYYDYYEKENGIPQILAAMYSTLTETDWYKVSTGNPQNKKTSNTSLNKSGLQKMKNNCLFCCSDDEYIAQLKAIKIAI
ncbi:MAG: hypothetical protein PUB10_10510 [Clostridiales bacterium]|nr:hypothetical protein [Clostridiales bacterium]